MIDGKTILITGAGFLAQALANDLLYSYKPKKIVLISRNEDKQRFAKEQVRDPRHLCRWLIGDTRDSARIFLAMKGVEVVIHTAAMKRVDDIEYNPHECIKTNVDGTWNVINACIERGVERAVFTSTDKAVHPINLYGATKMTGEKLWIHANYLRPIFTVTRYGNVMGSTGSVLPQFRQCAMNKWPFPVTDQRMTRFWVTPAAAVRLVYSALESEPGHTFVARSRSFAITDLCKALYGRAKIQETGIRPGEKIHETLVGIHERVTEGKDHWIIHPDIKFKEGKQHGELLPRAITSDRENMTQAQIREVLRDGDR